MSVHEQCPSTTGKKDPSKARARHKARTPHRLIGTSGQAYWRSLDDLADTEEFRGFLEKEFPAGASELLSGSRRTFMKLMGASLALAGAATIPGCRRPDHKIMPYSKSVPEEIIPGKAEYFATSMPFPGGGAEGLLVESHEGRPTKIEGNPLHSINRGKSSIWAQAAILSIYDPDRVKDPVFTDQGNSARSWDDFTGWSKIHFASFDGSKGAGLAFVVEKKTSPTRDAIKAEVLKRWPQALWVPYEAIDSDEPVRGSAAAFGRPMRELFHLEHADVIVSLDRDFLQLEPTSLVSARGFAAKRRPLKSDDSMNRLYVVESSMSITGGKADHRIAMAPSLIPAFAVALAKAVGVPGLASVEVPQGVRLDAQWVDEIAKDLNANKGRSVVMAGPTQPAAVHALVHAINETLGNAGKTVSYLPMGEDEAASSVQGLRALVDGLNGGNISTVVCLNVNPVYDAPAELMFASAFGKAKTRITLTVDENETIAASNWQLNGATFLESWGDTEASDGTLAPIQPLIAPLYAGKSDIEVLAIAAGLPSTDGYDLVRETWRKRLKLEGPAFEKVWRRALHDGVALAGPAAAATVAAGVSGRIAPMLSGLNLSTGPSGDSMDVVFKVWHVGDGRFANNAWLQELPDTATKIVWDNVAMLSPATAARLGVVPERETVKKRGATMVTVTIGPASVNIPAWVVPGLPDNTVVLPLGYGREVAGRVGAGVGFNTYKVRGSTSRRMATGAKVAAATNGPREYNISTTQQHGALEGRAVLREVDLPAWQKFGEKPFLGLSPEEQERIETDHYGNKRKINFAERLGDMAEAPAAKSIYVNPFNRSHDAPDTKPDAAGKPAAYAMGPQWGMSIDMSACIGCNACTIACQAENNIPVVGKIEVNKHREMHWIRVDRYFVNSPGYKGDPTADPALSMCYQPVACVHCENAPCETVCPVNATVHGPEGLNYMTYNRCIGTRYCANNCPYKVRRFNFFDFGVAKFNGDFIGKENVPGGGPKNVNLIPPRLRERLDEITKMGMNPNVTVRSRGVMEKCSYCVQRINEARMEVKLSNLPGIPDGFFQTACAQACPTDAIVFGDLLDAQKYTDENGERTGSRVKHLKENGRSYLLLGHLDTRPRTTHMVSVRNPNPAIREPLKELKDLHAEEEKKHATVGNRSDDGPAWHEDEGFKMSLTVLSGGRA